MCKGCQCSNARLVVADGEVIKNSDGQDHDFKEMKQEALRLAGIINAHHEETGFNSDLLFELMSLCSLTGDMPERSDVEIMSSAVIIGQMEYRAEKEA